jgi:hypothetical protein
VSPGEGRFAGGGAAAGRGAPPPESGGSPLTEGRTADGTATTGAALVFGWEMIGTTAAGGNSTTTGLTGNGLPKPDSSEDEEASLSSASSTAERY